MAMEHSYSQIADNLRAEIREDWCAKVEAAEDLLSALEEVPIHRLGETPMAFIERFKTWYRDVRNPALEKAGSKY